MRYPKKERVIQLVKRWLKRSGLSIEQVLARIQVKGWEISRFTFENHFTTRKNRALNVPPDLIVALVKAFTEGLYPSEQCTAEEAVELAILTRLPLDQFNKLSCCFPPEKFETAYRCYAPPSQSWQHTSPKSHNSDRLPKPLTNFVGRSQEVETIKRLLLQGRLLTLTGPGGCGKTRLALHVARQIHDRFKDGEFFVPLATIKDPDLVVSTIARVLGVRETSEQSLEENITAHLWTKDVLLILDNFEHLITAAPFVTSLLRITSGLKILVTSRITLRVSGEQEFAVPPLQLPNLHLLSPLNALSHCASIKLFVARAQAVKHNFALTENNIASIAEICLRLDGLPLAIELAAVRTKLFTPQEILARLSQRMAFLTQGTQDAPARHQTLRAAIDWSYQLLTPTEQTMFTRLAIFRGGCTLQAVDKICNINDDLPERALPILSTLLNHSILQRESGIRAESRFTMLETLREYAWEHLIHSGDMTLLCEQHAHYYLVLVQQAQGELRGSQQDFWLDQLEQEQHNIRAALTWALEQQHPVMAFQFCDALELFWYWHSHLSEGRKWIQALLTQYERELPATMQAKALDIAAGLAWAQSDFNTAVELGQLSLTIFRRTGDKSGIAGTLNTLGLVAESKGEYSKAIRLYEDCLRLQRELEDPAGIALLLHNLGDTLLAHEEPEQATVLFKESLSIYRHLDNKYGIATVLGDLGDVALYEGHSDQAEAFYIQGLTLYWQTGGKQSLALWLERLAKVAVFHTHYTRALQLFGAAEKLRQDTGTTLSFFQRIEHERAIATVQAQVSVQEFTATWNAGYTLPIAQVINYALTCSEITTTDEEYW